MTKFFLLFIPLFPYPAVKDFHYWRNFSGSARHVIVPAQNPMNGVTTTVDYLVLTADPGRKAKLFITNTKLRGNIHIEIPITLPYNQLVKIRLSDQEELAVVFDSTTTGNLYVSGSSIN